TGGNHNTGGSLPASTCTTEADCPPSDSPCKHASCAQGKCGFIPEAAGLVLPSQLRGDCQKFVCDGNGSIDTVADPSDTNNDGRECTQDTCNGSHVRNSFLQKGTPCTENNGKVCDGIGNCVECTVANDCTDVGDVCSLNHCVPQQCTD